MGVNWAQVAAIIAVTSAICHTFLYIGILIARMKVVEERQADHQRRLDSHDAELRDLRG